MKIEYNVEVPEIAHARKGKCCSEISAKAIEFVNSNNQVMAIHLDTVDEAKSKAACLNVLRRRGKINCNIWRRGNSVYLVKEDV